MEGELEDTNRIETLMGQDTKEFQRDGIRNTGGGHCPTSESRDMGLEERR